MEEFLVKKAKMFLDIKKLREMLDNMDISLDIYNRNVENYSFEYNNIMNETWKNLMKIELELHEQMEEVNETFGHTITDMMNAFIESAQGMFTHIRSQEVNYNELISEAVGRYNTNLTISGDEITVPPILKPILIDKESIHNALSTSHDCHMQIIDQREDLLLNRAKNWMEKFVSNLETDEISRNRSKVLEINHFLDVQKDEFKELSTDVYHQIVAQDLTED